MQMRLAFFIVLYALFVSKGRYVWWRRETMFLAAFSFIVYRYLSLWLLYVDVLQILLYVRQMLLRICVSV